MIFEVITLGECEELYFIKGINTIISNGEIVGFEKSFDGSSTLSKFVFFRKSERKGSNF
jgi:hypothetical protein